MPVNVSAGEEIFSGTITNLSDSGAALEFIPDLGKQDVSFEIGNSVSIETKPTDRVPGNVIRQYKGGIAVQFSAENKDILRPISEIVDGELNKKDS